MLRNSYLFFIVGILMLNACKPSTSSTEYNKKAADPSLYHESVDKLTEVIIHDIFKPPVAARIYAYANLAGYEALVPGDAKCVSLGGQLKGFEAVPAPEKGQEYCFPLASTRAFLLVARALTFSGEFFDEYEKTFYDKYLQMGVPTDVYERSMAYGDTVAAHVIKYSSKDNYKQTRGFRYTVTNKEGTWVPTPPAYADACEPQWGIIRSMAMDSSRQFMPPPPPPFSRDKSSPFWKEVMEVYNIGKGLSEEQKRIAYFWDDNSFVMNVAGHVMFANKKMTPAGHWMAIIKTVCKKNKVEMMPSVEAYTLTSIALLDAFINCWEAKYKFVRIRPETVINESVDHKWVPYLQTPPFPEYTGGHSTISAAAAEVLTGLMGDSVAFTDSTEFKYGHGVMSFKSFRDAAAMASISRVYGGIHFRSGCEEGAKMGVKVGQNVLAVVKSKK